MNKAELIKRIETHLDKAPRKNGLGKSFCIGMVIDALTTAVGETLASGEEVKLSGFGTWEPVTRKARKGRDPRTGAEIDIKESRGVTFRPGKGLKGALNNA